MRRSAVHPHVRGDNAYLIDAEERGVGSPPRAWGQWDREVDPRLGDRFTPTCVGTIPCQICAKWINTVHPHVRGDNSSGRVHIGVLPGSPPRAWGQLSLLSVYAGVKRFTPTCVGTISGDIARHSPRTVHPHVRGDNISKPNSNGRPGGSPPRAWGQSV